MNTFPLSLTGKRWILRSEMKHGTLLGEHIAKERGIDLVTEVAWSDLCDPSTLGDLADAVSRIRKAVTGKEGIGIIGDYDADGITGVAQLVRYFRRHGIDPCVILPHREKHGYGMKRRFIDMMRERGVTLILTVDTGISHAEEIAYAKSFDIEVIVTDHHSPKDVLPDALIVHPTALHDHANPHLCGSGVVFTLIRALEDNMWKGKEEDLALAAVGTVADIVPLLGENRTIVQLGLKVMSNTSIILSACPDRRSGRGKKPSVKDVQLGDERQTITHAPIFQLAHSVIKKDDTITSSHIGYRIAPRINAAGRLADPMIALDALLAGGKELERLQHLNDERKAATKRMMEIVDRVMNDDAPLCIARSPAFHPGIIGLIAGRLTESTGKPSVVCSEAGGVLTCSLRSIAAYHIVDALRRNDDYLETYGGHAMAAGCTLHSKNWERFSTGLLNDAALHLSAENLTPTLYIDGEITKEDLTLLHVQSLLALEPFGAGNEEPRFVIKNQTLSSLRTVGEDGSHLQCFVGTTKAVGFCMASLCDRLTETVDIVCRLGIDTWNGNYKVQMFIEDIAVAKRGGFTSSRSASGLTRSAQASHPPLS